MATVFPGADLGKMVTDFRNNCLLKFRDMLHYEIFCIFFIMSNSENVTDFCKTVETGMGPGFLQNIFFILLNLF